MALVVTYPSNAGRLPLDFLQPHFRPATVHHHDSPAPRHSSLVRLHFQGQELSRLLEDAKAYCASLEAVAASALSGKFSGPEWYEKPIGVEKVVLGEGDGIPEDRAISIEEALDKPIAQADSIIESAEQDILGTSSTSIEDANSEALTANLTGFLEKVKGKMVFSDADNINPDSIYPAKYTYQDNVLVEKMAEVCVENYDPEFDSIACEGDILVAGFNSERGSSREQLRQYLEKWNHTSPATSSLCADYRSCKTTWRIKQRNKTWIKSQELLKNLMRQHVVQNESTQGYIVVPVNKRQADDPEDEQGEYNEDNDDRRPPDQDGGDSNQGKSVRASKKWKPRYFACHYVKNHPVEFSRCGMAHFERIGSNLFNHLESVHGKHVCSGCWETSNSTVESLDHHELFHSTPAILTRTAADGGTTTHTAKPSEPASTEAEKWKLIYRSIFPGQPVPEPYIDELVQFTDQGVIVPLSSTNNRNSETFVEERFLQDVNAKGDAEMSTGSGFGSPEAVLASSEGGLPTDPLLESALLEQISPDFVLPSLKSGTSTPSLDSNSTPSALDPWEELEEKLTELVDIFETSHVDSECRIDSTPTPDEPTPSETDTPGDTGAPTQGVPSESGGGSNGTNGSSRDTGPPTQGVPNGSGGGSNGTNGSSGGNNPPNEPPGGPPKANGKERRVYRMPTESDWICTKPVACPDEYNIETTDRQLLKCLKSNFEHLYQLVKHNDREHGVIMCGDCFENFPDIEARNKHRASTSHCRRCFRAFMMDFDQKTCIYKQSKEYSSHAEGTCKPPPDKRREWTRDEYRWHRISQSVNDNLAAESSPYFLEFHEAREKAAAGRSAANNPPAEGFAQSDQLQVIIKQHEATIVQLNKEKAALLKENREKDRRFDAFMKIIATLPQLIASVQSAAEPDHATTSGIQRFMRALVSVEAKIDASNLQQVLNATGSAAVQTDVPEPRTPTSQNSRASPLFISNPDLLQGSQTTVNGLLIGSQKRPASADILPRPPKSMKLSFADNEVVLANQDHDLPFESNQISNNVPLTDLTSTDSMNGMTGDMNGMVGGMDGMTGDINGMTGSVYKMDDEYFPDLPNFEDLNGMLEWNASEVE